MQVHSPMQVLLSQLLGDLVRIIEITIVPLHNFLLCIFKSGSLSYPTYVASMCLLFKSVSKIYISFSYFLLC